jgi:hypothetical protein
MEFFTDDEEVKKFEEKMVRNLPARSIAFILHKVKAIF